MAAERQQTSSELRQINWLRHQWKRFSQLLWGALGGVWLVCCAGVLLAGDDEFLVRYALLLMLVLVTAYGVRLMLHARHQSRDLEAQAAALQQARLQADERG